MYGLVNKAIEQMVCRDHGVATWHEIRARAGVLTEAFISTQGYPDDVTYRLVAAASAVLDAPAEQILLGFGEFWVLETALKSYGSMMRAGGRNVREFLIKLPQLHDRVTMVYPELSPPRFTCSDVTDTSLRLHYSTARPAGLEPFVVGLIHGIGRMFSQPVEVRMTEDRNAGAAHSVFDVRWDLAA